MSGWTPPQADRSSAAFDSAFGRGSGGGGGPLSRELYARLDSIRSAGGMSAPAGARDGRAPSADVGPSPPPPQQRSMVLPDASPVAAPPSVALPDEDDNPSVIAAEAAGGRRERSLATTSVGALSPPGIRPNTTRLQDLGSKQTPPPSYRAGSGRGGAVLGDRSATIVAVSPVLTKAHLHPQRQSRDGAPAPWSGGADRAADAASVLVQLGDAASPPAKITRLPPTATGASVGSGGAWQQPSGRRQSQLPQHATPRDGRATHDDWTPHTYGRETTSRSTTAAGASPRPRRVADDSPVAIRMSRVASPAFGSGGVGPAREQRLQTQRPPPAPSSTAGSIVDHGGGGLGMIGEDPAVDLPEWPSRRASPKQDSRQHQQPRERQRSGSSERLTEASLRRLERNAAAREERRSRSQPDDAPRGPSASAVPPLPPPVELSITHFRSQGDARAEFARALRRRGAAPLPPSVCRACGTRCETSLDSPHATMWFCDGCGARLVNDG